MVLENATVLDNLLQQKTEMESQLEVSREMYLKVCGAIDVLQQIEEANNPAPAVTPEVDPTEQAE
jgi:hypothetical protein